MKKDICVIKMQMYLEKIFIHKEKQIMENKNHITSETSQSAPSRAELEQHMRARALRDNAFRQEFLTNPKAVLERDYAQCFSEGKIPSELSIKVIEEEEQAICFVFPSRSSDDQISDLENVDDEDLSSVSGGVTGFITCNSCVSCPRCDIRTFGCGSRELTKGIRL
jgi:hypothetical protein